MMCYLKCLKKAFKYTSTWRFARYTFFSAHQIFFQRQSFLWAFCSFFRTYQSDWLRDCFYRFYFNIFIVCLFVFVYVCMCVYLGLKLNLPAINFNDVGLLSANIVQIITIILLSSPLHCKHSINNLQAMKETAKKAAQIAIHLTASTQCDTHKSNKPCSPLNEPAA